MQKKGNGLPGVAAADNGSTSPRVAHDPPLGAHGPAHS